MIKTILIVDDEPEGSLPVEWVLRREGYDVALCSTIEEARDYIRNTPPDLILLDIMLPDENDSSRLNPHSGIDFLKALKSDDNPAKSIPVIMVTVRGEREIERECLKSGAAGYIRKMAAARELKRVVKEQIGPPVNNNSRREEEDRMTVTQIRRW